MSVSPEACEAILFVADRPVPVEVFAELFEATVEDVEPALTTLAQRYEQQSGIQLVQIAGGYQLSTKDTHNDLVTQFLKPAKQRLSRSLMEVLSVIAYNQPITLGEIDTVRGVHSDYGLRQLLERRLIKELGRKETPGRPALYGTTQQFLHQFQMNDLADLPTLTIETSPDQTALALESPRKELLST